MKSEKSVIVILAISGIAFLSMMAGVSRIPEMIQPTLLSSHQSPMRKTSEVKDDEPVNLTIKPPSDTPISPPPTRLWVCAQVRDEAPYALEWIEHYRHFGAERIILFDDDSQDNISLLPALYEQHNKPDFLTVLPAIASHYANESGADMNRRKQLNYKRCADLAHQQGVDWLAICDVDEFIYPSTYSVMELAKPHALAKALSELPDQQTSVQVKLRKFGPTAVQESQRAHVSCNDECDPKDCEKLQYHTSIEYMGNNDASLMISQNYSSASATSSRCRVRFVNQKNPKSAFYEPMEYPEMLTQSHKLRQRQKGETALVHIDEHKCVENNTLIREAMMTKLNKSKEEVDVYMTMSHNAGSYMNDGGITSKVIYRMKIADPNLGRCIRPGNHKCLGPKNRRVANPEEKKKHDRLFTGNHYLVRSFDEALKKAVNSHRKAPVTCFPTTEIIFTQVEDRVLHELANLYLGEAMKELAHVESMPV